MGTIKKLRVVDLKEALGALNLSTKGKKAELVARLTEYYESQQEEPEEQQSEKSPTPEPENNEVQQENTEISNTETNIEEEQPPTPEIVENPVETDEKSVEDPQTPDIIETAPNQETQNVSIPVEDYQPALEIISAEKSDEIAIVPDKTPKAVVDLVEEEEKEKPINLDEDDAKEPIQQPMSPENNLQFSAEPF